METEAFVDACKWVGDRFAGEQDQCPGCGMKGRRAFVFRKQPARIRIGDKDEDYIAVRCAWCQLAFFFDPEGMPVG